MFKKYFSAAALTLAMAFIAVPAFADSAIPSFESGASNPYVAFTARYRVTIQKGMEIQQIVVTSDSSDHAKWAVERQYYGWTVINVEYLGSI